MLSLLSRYASVIQLIIQLPAIPVDNRHPYIGCVNIALNTLNSVIRPEYRRRLSDVQRLRHKCRKVAGGYSAKFHRRKPVFPSVVNCIYAVYCRWRLKLLYTSYSAMIFVHTACASLRLGLNRYFFGHYYSAELIYTVTFCNIFQKYKLLSLSRCFALLTGTLQQPIFAHTKYVTI